MRTLLSQFCESFESIVRPLLDPFDGSNEALAASEVALPVREVRAELCDLRHQLEVLVDKVAEQQAYVLLFGPLKSGKSTLMNALAGTYVSEVSSLPAYPCMVYLSHRDERQLDVTRYSGRKERFTDPAALYLHVGRAHGELADRLRTTEEAGEEFDPAVHFPEAIRKVEVRIPAGELAQSGAVLVDTPGLYSRMKFGYDRMTREFRDAASCAIFVVKSDNLFLEQVFEEFEDLLDLFSRIFLVVNLDTAKRDLSPDGSLVPSLEREDPLRIIDAFENLAMSAPLKGAVNDGRLRIYPVDLLGAASKRLGGEDGEEARGQANFDAFRSDLTEYLNSTEYLVSFLGDSLRRARTLLSETLDALDHPAVGQLRAHADELDTQRQNLQRRRDAAARLVAHDWRTAFEELGEKLAPAIHERAKAAGGATEKQVDVVLDRWFGSGESLRGLVQDELMPHLHTYQDELATFVRQALEDEVQSGTGGIRLSTDVSADLYSAGADLTAVGRASLTQLNPALLRRDIAVPLHTSQIPVKRSLLDWVLLRPAQRVRDKLFGPAGSPNQPIPAEVKSRRLGKEARDAIRHELDGYKSRFFQETVQHIHQLVVGQYTAAVCEALRKTLAQRDEELEGELNAVVRDLMDHRKVLAHLSSLRQQADRAGGEIETLADQYGGTEPERLIHPLAPDAVPPIPSSGPLLTPGAVLELPARQATVPLAGEVEPSTEARPAPAEVGQDEGSD